MLIFWWHLVTFWRLPVGRIASNLAKTRESVSSSILLQNNFEIFPLEVVFPEKLQNSGFLGSLFVLELQLRGLDLERFESFSRVGEVPRVCHLLLSFVVSRTAWELGEPQIPQCWPLWYGEAGLLRAFWWQISRKRCDIGCLSNMGYRLALRSLTLDDLESCHLARHMSPYTGSRYGGHHNRK
jgi:hypothetical protein